MNMMLHHPRYDELDHLRAELEQEDRLKEGLDWSNGELERNINELETYVRELDDSNKGVDDNEWKVRYESQVGMNKQLAEQKDWLETELAEARRKLTTGSYPEAMNFNLDALSEAELLRLVKHLERMRNDFYSTLRDTEWKLDKESKEFHHFDEMRRVYKADLKHANTQIERMRLTLLDPSGLVSPLYPPGYFRWMDTHTPAPSRHHQQNEHHGSKSSKSPSRKTTKSKGSEQRSPSRSPTRTKSRNDKRHSKKKEEPPPEEATTTQRSETENGTEEEEEEEEEAEREEREEQVVEGQRSPKKKHSLEATVGEGGAGKADSEHHSSTSSAIRMKRDGGSKERLNE